MSYEELLQTADVISIHCPLSQETRHLISDPEFAMMRKGVMIVNTSRGAGTSIRHGILNESNLNLIVIDEQALVRAMESGRVARVGLDVFEKEPAVHPYLMQSERATLLPVSPSCPYDVLHLTSLSALGNVNDTYNHRRRKGRPC